MRNCGAGSDWLASSSNARSAKMGRWYLRQLEIEAEPQADRRVCRAGNQEQRQARLKSRAQLDSPRWSFTSIRSWNNSGSLWRAQGRGWRNWRSDYTKEKSRVDAMQAVLFRRLREHYQKRDRLRLIVDYRKKYLDSLIRGGEEEAKQAEENYEQAKAQSDKELRGRQRQPWPRRSS